MNHVLAVALGGALGAVCRHLVNLSCSHWYQAHATLGTLAVNVVGCFLIGFLIPLGTADIPRWNSVTHSALTVGFIGGLTTFSTLGWETHRLVDQSAIGWATLNMGSNIFLGLMAVTLGLQLGRWMGGM